VRSAAQWAQQLLPPGKYARHSWLGAQLNDSPFGCPLQVVVLPLLQIKGELVLAHLGGVVIRERGKANVQLLRPDAFWGACSWKALGGSPFETVGAAAFMAIDRVSRRPRPPPEPPPLASSGDDLGGESASATTAADRWSLYEKMHTATQRKVQQALLAAGGELAQYADRVGGTAFGDAPEGLRGDDPDARDSRWAREPFSPVILPPTTTPLPTLEPQRQTSWRPRRASDLLSAEAFDKLCGWLRQNVRDVDSMKSATERQGRPFKPHPLVLGQGDFVPEARGIIWDLRRAAEEVIVPLDFLQPVQSGLNVELLEELLRECPDRELLDHLRHGIDFKADIELQVVLLPHMASLSGNVELVEMEIERLVGCQWHKLFPQIPFLPIRLNPNGAVARKLEQSRPRRVENASADGGSTRGPLVDTSGVAVRSLNAMVGIRENIPAAAEPQERGQGAASEEAGSTGIPKWPKEQKPSVAAKVHDLAILRFAASVFKEELVGFVTDFKDYFNQFPVRAKYLWANIVHWRSLLGISGEDLGCFVSELRLGFGMSASSNICQRFAHALAEIFRVAFDREEDELFTAETDPVRREFVAARRGLGHGQHRLYEISIYTDDPFFACVGVERLIRAMRLWHRIITSVGLELAAPAKRQCGAELRWLGFEFLLTAGVQFVSTGKRLRTIARLLPIAAGVPSLFAEYRSVTSFLQHLLPFVEGSTRGDMYGIYGPYRRNAAGLLPHANSMVRPDELGLERLNVWVEVLRNFAGSRFAATNRGTRRPAPALELSIPLHSDAAKEANDVSGLGGFCAGLFWHMPLAGDELLLPISVLEFIAIGVNLIIFEPLARGSSASIFSDSLNAVHSLNQFAADSPLMQFTHSRVVKLDAYRTMVHPGGVEHCFGPANPCADAASRGRFRLLADICAQLGIRPMQLEVPQEARELIYEVLRFALRNGYTNASAKPRLHSTAVELGAATESANGFGHRGTAIDTNALNCSWRVRPERLAAPMNVTHPSEDAMVGGAGLACASKSSPWRMRPEHFAPVIQRVSNGIQSLPAPREGVGRGQQSPKRARALDQADDAPERKRTVPAGKHMGQQNKSLLGQVQELRAEQLCDALAQDESPLALRPANSSQLISLCSAHLAAAGSTPATGTVAADATSWRRWLSFCRTMGTPPLRAAAFDDTNALAREAILQSGFLIYLASIVEPRSKSAPAAKPQSLFNNLLAVRRVHRRLLVDFRVLRGAVDTLKAQIKQFIRDNGPEALLPARKEPLDASHLRRFFALKRGRVINGRQLDWNSPFFVSFKAALCTGLAAAFRKAELCLPDGAVFTLGRLSVASVSWYIDGQAVARPSPSQLRQLAQGDFCVLRPPLCKNDPFGLHFGTKPIWLPVSRDAANAATAIASMFLLNPAKEGDWTRVPLFRVNGGGDPLRHADADKTLRALIEAAFPEAEPSRWSMHSLRIGAACALLAAQASPALIQAICRWRSEKSLNIYARLGRADYGRFVLEIESRVVDAVTTKRLLETRIDYDSVVAALDGPIVIPEDA